ncbi:MAG: GFA family protein [Alphaproteobacteria bacterium]
MAEQVLTGGCQCGAVRYRVSAPADYTSHCHCTMCRKTHGALFATYSVVPSAELVLEGGRDALTLYKSSPSVKRSFCRNCGGTLFFQYDSKPEWIAYATGTLDAGAHPGHPPETERHIYVASKAPWHEITDGLPQFDEGSE